MIKLVVGLGNPGKEYENTFHNVGFMVLEKFKDKLDLDFKSDKKSKSEIAKISINNKEIIFCKPQTFMNLSGFSVKELKKEYGLKDEEILVIHDDLSVKIGKFRFEEVISNTKHNGILNIISSLTSKNFSRIRIGIQKPDEFSDTSSLEYVLMKIPEEIESKLKIVENEVLDFILQKIGD